MSIQEYYDLAVHDIEKYESEIVPSISKMIRTDIILKYLGEGKKNVLDVGGGTGRYTIEMLKAGHLVTLNDLSNKSLTLAKEKIIKMNMLKEVNFLEGDIEEIQLENNIYDYIICEGSTFSYISEPSKFLKKMWKSLKPEGILILTAASLYGILLNRSGVIKKLIPEPTNKWDFLKEAVVEKLICEDKELNVNIRAYTIDELKHLLISEKFEYIESYGRNIWDLFLNKEEVEQIIDKHGIPALIDFETALHKNHSLIDICHSFAVIARKKE